MKAKLTENISRFISILTNKVTISQSVVWELILILIYENICVSQISFILFNMYAFYASNANLHRYGLYTDIIAIF